MINKQTPKNSDIILGYSCNNNCMHCIRASNDKTFNISTEKVKSFIDEAKKRKVTRLVLQGGEPTIREDFFDILNYAKEKFKHIQIQSNGRMFSYEDFAKQAIENGATDFTISIHNKDEPTHDEFTGIKGSYNQTIQGIINLQNQDANIKILLIVTKKNYKNLLEIVTKLSELNITNIQIGILNPEGKAKKNFNEVCIQLTKIKPYLIKTFEYLKKNNINFTTQDIPLCILDKFKRYNLEQTLPDAEKIFPEEFYANYNSERQSKKAYMKICYDCPDKKNCEGIYQEYIRQDFF